MLVKMMHRIKKRTAQVTLKQTPENAEFNQLRSALENLAQYLKASSKDLNDCERSWSNICNTQKVFAETFASRCTDKDDIREMSKQSALASEQLMKKFTLRSEGDDARHWKIDAMIHEYLAEINSLPGEYKKITPAYTEVARYSKKVSDLQKTKKTSEDKIARNMEKLEEAKKKYADIMESLIEKMKEVYNKRQVALKANYIAYWSSQLRAFDLIRESLSNTREYVTGSETELCSLDIRKMRSADVAKFIAGCSVLQSSEPKKSNSSVPASTLVTAKDGGSSVSLAERPSSLADGASGGDMSTGEFAPHAQVNNDGITKDIPSSPVEDTGENPSSPVETAH